MKRKAMLSSLRLILINYLKLQRRLMFRVFPFEPYAPVRRQLLAIVRRVNECRAAAGLERLPYSVLRLKRRIYRPFEADRATAF